MSTKYSRPDDYELRRTHLSDMTDEELKTYFWSLADKAVSPLLELAKTHTSPSIERSVLLRMGFSSIEAKAIVDKTIAHQLISKGCGHVVFKYATLKKISVRDAGLSLANDIGFDEVLHAFEVTR